MASESNSVPQRRECDSAAVLAPSPDPQDAIAKNFMPCDLVCGIEPEFGSPGTGDQSIDRAKQIRKEISGCEGQEDKGKPAPIQGR
jgi:hypothetical protein